MFSIIFEILILIIIWKVVKRGLKSPEVIKKNFPDYYKDIYMNGNRLIEDDNWKNHFDVEIIEKIFDIILN